MSEEKEIAEMMKASLADADKEVTTEEEDLPEYSEVEQSAISMGWNPEGVEGKRNISAEEFVERKSLYDRIHKLEKQVKGSDKVVDALKKYNEQIAEKAYERALSDLKSQKFEALENGDSARVLQIDDELEKLKVEKPQVPVEENTEAYSPEEWSKGFNSFAKDNVWYGRRPEMTEHADNIGSLYKQTNPDVSPEELFAYVQGEIKTKYQDFFEDLPRPTKVAAGGKRVAGSGNKKTLKDVPEGDREIALTLIRSGTLTEEEYIKSYFG